MQLKHANTILLLRMLRRKSICDQLSHRESTC